jgi:hypothetical protein
MFHHQYRYLILIENLTDLLTSADRVWFGIQGIWNLIFTLSNLALFLFLPFAYLLCESEGFIGAKVSFTASHRIFVFRSVLRILIRDPVLF